MGVPIPHGRVGKALKPHVGEHGHAAVLTAFDRYLREHVEEGRGQFATVENFASRYGYFANGGHRKASGYADPAESEDYEELAKALHGSGE